MMEAVRTSETLMRSHRFTRRYNPESCHLPADRRTNFKSNFVKTVLKFDFGVVQSSGLCLPETKRISNAQHMLAQTTKTKVYELKFDVSEMTQRLLANPQSFQPCDGRNNKHVFGTR
jgi:hypothetical protein